MIDEEVMIELIQGQGIDWVLVIAVVSLCVGALSLVCLWKIAQYITEGEMQNNRSLENLMKLVLHIGRETDTLRPGIDPNAVPPNTTIH